MEFLRFASIQIELDQLNESQHRVRVSQISNFPIRIISTLISIRY